MYFKTRKYFTIYIYNPQKQIEIKQTHNKHGRFRQKVQEVQIGVQGRKPPVEQLEQFQRGPQQQRDHLQQPGLVGGLTQRGRVVEDAQVVAEVAEEAGLEEEGQGRWGEE